MKKVITYGSFDLFHEGHLRLLERAKALGDYLIVGVTTEHYDKSRGKLNVVDDLITRYNNVKACEFVDEVIVEDHSGQKVEDIIKYKIDKFAIGSDWVGKFDYLGDYTEVVYLERTKEVSSTLLRSEKYKIIKLGIIGTGRIADRFVTETKFVSGLTARTVYNPNVKSMKKFAKTHTLNYVDSENDFFDEVDAVYIASPHKTHYSYIKKAIEYGKHVLCEKPITLNEAELRECFDLAKEKGCILMEGIKTAYAPGFNQLLGVARSGVIGSIRDVEASFTKLTPDKNLRELTNLDDGGSFTELASYTLLPIIKLLGGDYNDLKFCSIKSENGLDLYTKAYFTYKNAFATSKTGLGVKSEGQLLISGTNGYILSKSPWWLTKQFEICYENSNKNTIHETVFLGDGLRYELSEFVSAINGYKKNSDMLTPNDSIEIAKIIELFLNERKNK